MDMDILVSFWRRSRKAAVPIVGLIVAEATVALGSVLVDLSAEIGNDTRIGALLAALGVWLTSNAVDVEHAGRGS